MSIEMRWLTPAETTTKSPVLQYRVLGPWPLPAGPWVDVPVVVAPSVTSPITLSELPHRAD
jgi:hypothetical protein